MNSGFLGLSLLAYASWQTLHLLAPGPSRTWARKKYYRYVPRPSARSLKRKESCGQCAFYSSHPDFQRSGVCDHPEWKEVLKAQEVLVKRDGHCELWGD